MHLEELKRWQWCVIGLMTGLLLSWVLVSLPQGQLPRNIGTGDFEALLSQASTDRVGPLTDIIVQPRVGDTQVITGKRLSESLGDAAGFTPFSLVTHLPYSSLDLGMTYPTLQARMADAVRRNPAIHYHYAWWWTPAGIFVLWTEAAILVIGGIWPSVIQWLVGAGYGRKQVDAEYDLDRFSNDESTPATGRTGSTANAGNWSGGDPLSASESRPSAAVPVTQVKALSAGPLEVTLPADEEKDKQYAGVFYPTIVHRPGDTQSGEQ